MALFLFITAITIHAHTLHASEASPYPSYAETDSYLQCFLSYQAYVQVIIDGFEKSRAPCLNRDHMNKKYPLFYPNKPCINLEVAVNAINAIADVADNIKTEIFDAFEVQLENAVETVVEVTKVVDDAVDRISDGADHIKTEIDNAISAAADALDYFPWSRRRIMTDDEKALVSTDCLSNDEYETIQNATESIKRLECIAHPTDPETRNRLPLNTGILFEVTGAISAGISRSWSIGISHDHGKTYTKCEGIKGDFEASIGVSMTIFPDSHDILGTSYVLGLGLDISNFIGVDVMAILDSKGNCIGSGSAVSIGPGVFPIDMSVHKCETTRGYKTVFGIEIDALNDWDDWQCAPHLIGVIEMHQFFFQSELIPRVCCPENNDAQSCSSGYCWFTGDECPTNPQCKQTASVGHSTDTSDYIGKAFCGGMSYFPEITSLWHCNQMFWMYDRWMIGKWYKELNECWLGDESIFCNCVYAPVVEPYAIWTRNWKFDESSCDFDCDEVSLSDPWERIVYKYGLSVCYVAMLCIVLIILVIPVMICCRVYKKTKVPMKQSDTFVDSDDLRELSPLKS